MAMSSSKAQLRSRSGASNRSKRRGADATSFGFLRSPKGIATVAGLALALGAISWAVAGRSASGAPKSTLPRELQVAALKAETADPAKLRETVRGAFERADLTPEQRRELRGNMREVFVGAMTERVDAYFDAPEDQKTAVLDSQIDQFVAQMAEWRKRREGREERLRDGGREGFSPPSQAERKERSESRNPDQTARNMAYFSAVRARMTERGLQPPGGGRGGPGGGGGGFGRRGP